MDRSLQEDDEVRMASPRVFLLLRGCLMRLERGAKRFNRWALLGRRGKGGEEG